MTQETKASKEAPARAPKGQSFYTWDDTTDWIEHPAHKLRYKPIAFGKEGVETRALLVQYDPGSEIPVHSHPSDYCSIVVAGSIEITRRIHEVGSVRVVKAGTAYGPLKVGESGCTVIDVFAAGPKGIDYIRPGA